MIVAVGSWRGLGTTTTAMLTAACLSTSDVTGSWLIEADPAGGTLAGRLQLASASLAGLERVAFPTTRVSAVEAFESVCHQVDDLRIVTSPTEPFRAHACHTPRNPWPVSLRELSRNVVVDVGRLRSSTAVWPILALADVVLVVTSPEVSAVVATTEWLDAGGRVSPSDPGIEKEKIRLVFVDAPCGVAFPCSTLRLDVEAFGGWLPWEPGTVDLLHRGASVDDRRFRRSQLMSAANEVVRDVVTGIGGCA